MNNLEYLFAHDRGRILRNLTMEDHPCRICPKHDVTNPDVCDSGRCTEVMREWLTAEHVDDESCNQVADQREHAETPPASKWRSNDAQKVIPNAEKYKLESNSEGVSHTEDSREKLEADVRWQMGHFFAWDENREEFVGYVLEWLDRQAAITSKEWCWTNDSLQEQVNMLTEQRDHYIELFHEQEQRANETKAERDEWKEKAEARSQGWAKANIGWAEANAEAERWRQRCARMQGNRGWQCEDEAREIAAERDYWKQEVALCMQSAYPPSHSPERAYDPDVMAYPDRHGCTTPSTLVSAVIDGLRDEQADAYMKLLDEVTKLGDDLKACQGQLKTERNNFVQMQGARDYWRDKLAMVLRRLKELGCEVGGLHDVPIRVELPPRDEGLA